MELSVFKTNLLPNFKTLTQEKFSFANHSENATKTALLNAILIKKIITPQIRKQYVYLSDLIFHLQRPREYEQALFTKEA